MVDVRVLRSLTAADRADIDAFLDKAEIDDCSQLDDHLQADLRHGPRPGFVAALATEDGRTVGYAQASSGNQGFVVDSIVWSGANAHMDQVRAMLLRALLDTLPEGAQVTWWADEPQTSDPLAESLGMEKGRTLLQMRCPLPLTVTTDVTTRPFVVGVDEVAWLEVNNAAFAWHAEQGGWDLATLHQREQEEWFRPDGFLLHERGGRLAAFCWTKLHHAEQVGEIYVIAVHPDFHGLGLGRALTVAGLSWLHRAGATEGMLYVDAGNTSAVSLYRTLGFEVAHTDQAYVRS